MREQQREQEQRREQERERVQALLLFYHKQPERRQQ